MKNSKVALAGLIAGIALCASVLGLQACHTYPEGAGEVITRTLGQDVNGGQVFYAIYVREYEADEDGKEVIKCYELTEDEYNSLEIGDTYIPKK